MIDTLRLALKDAVSERDRLWMLYCEASKREIAARVALNEALIDAVKDEDEA